MEDYSFKATHQVNSSFPGVFPAGELFQLIDDQYVNEDETVSVASTIVTDKLFNKIK